MELVSSMFGKSSKLSDTRYDDIDGLNTVIPPLSRINRSATLLSFSPCSLVDENESLPLGSNRCQELL